MNKDNDWFFDKWESNFDKNFDKNFKRATVAVVLIWIVGVLASLGLTAAAIYALIMVGQHFA